MRPLETFQLDEPLAGASAYVAGQQLMVQCVDGTWIAPLSTLVGGAVAERGGLVLLLTHAVKPGEVPLNPRELDDLFKRGQVSLGWVTVDRSRAPSAAMLDVLVDPHPTRP